jgi:4-hydroxy-3-methylbut-2-enyl diphosphate reductase IspH
MGMIAEGEDLPVDDVESRRLAGRPNGKINAGASAPEILVEQGVNQPRLMRLHP